MRSQWVLPALAALAVGIFGAEAKHWLAVSADRNKELQTCADQMLGGKIDFSLSGVRTGHDICSSIGETCLEVMDWQCVDQGCDASSEGSRATRCDGQPAPPSPPPSPPPAPSAPTSHACLPGGPAKDLPFCNTSLTFEKRVKDLISRMSTSEKAKYLGDGATTGGGGIESLGIPPYSWNTEALHGLGAMCLNAPDGSVRCPTVFPAPPGLGAAFNRSLAHVVGDTIGTETRAMNNAGGCRNRGGGGCGWHNGNWYIGLNVWVPSLNIYRDPRWGRNVEVPSEDPYHSGQYGAALVRGVQEGDDPRYTKASAALKHFGFYSVEDGRNNKNFDISQHDIADTYLPGFENAIREGKAQGYMCSYASVNGIPSCASKFLSSKARDEWGMVGYVQTDCGGIGGMTHDQVKYAKSKEDAAAKGLKDGGVDISCGGTLPDNINQAVSHGLASQADIDASLERSLGLLFRAGMFDPLDDQPYTKIKYTEIGAATSSGVALDAARQSLVLLKNDAADADSTRSTLPLRSGLRILVAGPHADTSQTLAGNYFEDICPPSNKTCVPSVAASLAAADPSAKVSISAGCKDTGCKDTSGIDATVAAVADVDVVVLVLGRSSNPLTSLQSASGQSPGREGEGSDVSDIRLPAGQLKLALAVADAAAGKPVVAVLVSGGLVAVEELKASAKVPAIVQAFYPGVAGGQALAEGVLGLHNRWSKLPFTYYAYNYTQSIDMDNMNMTDGVGRSYKYLKDPSLALWPFGWGLSYTNFAVKEKSMTNELSVLMDVMRRASEFESLVSVSVTVTNTGKVAGDEVVFLFHSGPKSKAEDPQANKVLVGFERVSLEAGESQVVDFQVSARSLSYVDTAGSRLVRSGMHSLFVSRDGTSTDLTFDLLVDGGDDALLINRLENGIKMLV